MRLAAICMLCSAFLSLARNINEFERTLTLERLSLGFPRDSFDFEGLGHVSVKKDFDVNAFITISEDDAEYLCWPQADWIPSPPTYHECELEKLDFDTRVAADSDWREGNFDEYGRYAIANLDDDDTSPGRFFFTIIPPFAGHKRRVSYFSKPLKINFRYETTQGANLTTDVVIRESELVYNATDPKGGNYQHAIVRPLIYRMFPELST